MSQIVVTDVKQKGNFLDGTVTITISQSAEFSTEYSPEFVINGAAGFQFRLTVFVNKYRGYNYTAINYLIFVGFNKRHAQDAQDALTYVIKFTSTKLGIQNKSFTIDDGTWHLIHESESNTLMFDVAVAMEIVPSPCPFTTLHEDTKLTDFELRGKDGSVHVHRAVLAAISPVLNRLMAGSWREATEGIVDVPNTSQTTLQHFKDYVYLHTLPESGLEQLLLLASYYMIPELEQICINKLIHNASDTNACELLEFASVHKMRRLLLAVLDIVRRGVLDVSAMRNHYLGKTNTSFIEINGMSFVPE